METIFDIFGSREPVKLPAANAIPQASFPLKGSSSEGSLPGKPILHGSLNVKGKNVLSDVGNKIKVNTCKKAECSSQGALKKAFQNNSSSSKMDPKTNSVQKSMIHDHGFKTDDKFPDVEYQGSSFWNEECYPAWIEESYPTMNDFSFSSNIWNIEKRQTGLQDVESSSPLSNELYDDVHLCLDLPNVSINDIPKMDLEKASVKLPWEF